MKKQIINERGVIITIYKCPYCDSELFTDLDEYGMDDYGEWKYCPYCSTQINYDYIEVI